jgi:hypothetical protein
VHYSERTVQTAVGSRKRLLRKSSRAVSQVFRESHYHRSLNATETTQMRVGLFEAQSKLNSSIKLLSARFDGTYLAENTGFIEIDWQ